MAKILVVDDDIDLLDMSKEEIEGLMPEDVIVVTARTLAEAKQTIDEDKDREIGIAIIDMELGDERGIELINYIKAKKLQISIIATSGVPRYALDAINAGAEEFLLKPRRIAELIAEAAKKYGHSQI